MISFITYIVNYEGVNNYFIIASNIIYFQEWRNVFKGFNNGYWRYRKRTWYESEAAATSAQRNLLPTARCCLTHVILACPHSSSHIPRSHHIPYFWSTRNKISYNKSHQNDNVYHTKTKHLVFTSGVHGYCD
jgi:hypothetical protein